MPVPSSFDDLSETPSSNSPSGSESVGTQANEYIQTAFAFIKQLRDGLMKPTAAVDVNGQKITNGAAATLSTTSKDFVIGSQMYKVGEVRMWHGAVANIAATWGVGWQLADGTNGTSDLRSKFVVGAGSTFAPNATGGTTTNTIAIANLPVHNHAVVDPGHNHAIALGDAGHSHSVADPGHAHAPKNGGQFYGTNGGPSTGGSTFGLSFQDTTAAATTGVSVQPASSNISVSLNPAVTGISTSNTGSGTAVNNLPPYYALCFIEYTG